MKKFNIEALFTDGRNYSSSVLERTFTDAFTEALRQINRDHDFKNAHLKSIKVEFAAIVTNS